MVNFSKPTVLVACVVAAQTGAAPVPPDVSAVSHEQHLTEEHKPNLRGLHEGNRGHDAIEAGAAAVGNAVGRAVGSVFGGGSSTPSTGSRGRSSNRGSRGGSSSSSSSDGGSGGGGGGCSIM